MCKITIIQLIIAVYYLVTYMELNICAPNYQKLHESTTDSTAIETLRSKCEEEESWNGGRVKSVYLRQEQMDGLS